MRAEDVNRWADDNYRLHAQARRGTESHEYLLQAQVHSCLHRLTRRALHDRPNAAGNSLPRQHVVSVRSAPHSPLIVPNARLFIREVTPCHAKSLTSAIADSVHDGRLRVGQQHTRVRWGGGCVSMK